MEKALVISVLAAPTIYVLSKEDGSHVVILMLQNAGRISDSVFRGIANYAWRLLSDLRSNGTAQLIVTELSRQAAQHSLSIYNQTARGLRNTVNGAAALWVHLMDAPTYVRLRLFPEDVDRLFPSGAGGEKRRTRGRGAILELEEPELEEQGEMEEPPIEESQEALQKEGGTKETTPEDADPATQVLTGKAEATSNERGREGLRSMRRKRKAEDTGDDGAKKLRASRGRATERLWDAEMDGFADVKDGVMRCPGLLDSLAPCSRSKKFPEHGFVPAYFCCKKHRIQWEKRKDIEKQ